MKDSDLFFILGNVTLFNSIILAFFNSLATIPVTGYMIFLFYLALDEEKKEKRGRR